jgi:hypothetical protein
MEERASVEWEADVREGYGTEKERMIEERNMKMEPTFKTHRWRGRQNA